LVALDRRSTSATPVSIGSSATASKPRRRFVGRSKQADKQAAAARTLEALAAEGKKKYAGGGWFKCGGELDDTGWPCHGHPFSFGAESDRAKEQVRVQASEAQQKRHLQASQIIVLQLTLELPNKHVQMVVLGAARATEDDCEIAVTQER
jgi:hypothetical protein